MSHEVKEVTVTITRRTMRRLWRAVSTFLTSKDGGKARWLLFALFALMLCINGMNVANSYVGRWFMSAIERRDSAGFVRFAWLFLAVFGGSTLVGVLFRFTEERLGLLWRENLTRRITAAYIDQGLYRIHGGEGAVTNPDQRMTEDVRQLTTTTLSFVLMVINGTMAAISFSGVLWAISPKLFMIAVLYALGGSALTIWLGRPLIRLNYRQSDFEANFRSELIHIHDRGREIDPANGHGLKQTINDRIDDVVMNFRRIIAVNRNLNFFTSGYNYLIQLIPVVVVAPMFIEHKVEFGVIGQSAMAFATLLGAFSLVITQFQAISSYASVVARLSEFVEHAEKSGGRKA